MRDAPFLQLFPIKIYFVQSLFRNYNVAAIAANMCAATRIYIDFDGNKTEKLIFKFSNLRRMSSFTCEQFYDRQTGEESGDAGNRLQCVVRFRMTIDG